VVQEGVAIQFQKDRKLSPITCPTFRKAQMQKEFVLNTEPDFFFAVPDVT